MALSVFTRLLFNSRPLSVFAYSFYWCTWGEGCLRFTIWADETTQFSILKICYHHLIRTKKLAEIFQSDRDQNTPNCCQSIFLSYYHNFLSVFLKSALCNNMPRVYQFLKHNTRVMPHLVGCRSVEYAWIFTAGIYFLLEILNILYIVTTDLYIVIFRV